MISIDDLNDWVGVLGGHSQARTPTIDRLAGEAVSVCAGSAGGEWPGFVRGKWMT